MKYIVLIFVLYIVYKLLLPIAAKTICDKVNTGHYDSLALQVTVEKAKKVVKGQIKGIYSLTGASQIIITEYIKQLLLNQKENENIDRRRLL